MRVLYLILFSIFLTACHQNDLTIHGHNYSKLHKPNKIINLLNGQLLLRYNNQGDLVEQIVFPKLIKIYENNKYDHTLINILDDSKKARKRLIRWDGVVDDPTYDTIYRVNSNTQITESYKIYGFNVKQSSGISYNKNNTINTWIKYTRNNSGKIIKKENINVVYDHDLKLISSGSKNANGSYHQFHYDDNVLVSSENFNNGAKISKDEYIYNDFGLLIRKETTFLNSENIKKNKVKTMTFNYEYEGLRENKKNL